MWNEHDQSRRIRAARGLDPNPQTPHPEKEIRTENVFVCVAKRGRGREGGREAGREKEKRSEGGRERKREKEKVVESRVCHEVVGV